MEEALAKHNMNARIPKLLTALSSLSGLRAVGSLMWGCRVWGTNRTRLGDLSILQMSTFFHELKMFARLWTTPARYMLQRLRSNAMLDHHPNSLSHIALERYNNDLWKWSQKIVHRQCHQIFNSSFCPQPLSKWPTSREQNRLLLNSAWTLAIVCQPTSGNPYTRGICLKKSPRLRVYFPGRSSSMKRHRRKSSWGMWKSSCSPIGIKRAK